jgi:hypothetical protein
MFVKYLLYTPPLLAAAPKGRGISQKNIKNPFQKIPESFEGYTKTYPKHPYIKHYENSLFFPDFKTFLYCFITFCYHFVTFSNIFYSHFVIQFGTNELDKQGCLLYYAAYPAYLTNMV